MSDPIAVLRAAIDGIRVEAGDILRGDIPLTVAEIDLLAQSIEALPPFLHRVISVMQARGRDAREKSMLDEQVAKHGLTDIHRISSGRWAARDRSGLPVVVRVGESFSHQRPASRAGDVGPGPAVEGVVDHGRTWRSLADLRWGHPSFHIRAWRLAATP